VCSRLSGDIILLKINSHECSRNHYLWIININVQNEGQIHPKHPPDVTSCSTEQGPGAWDNVTMAKNPFYVNMFFTRRSFVHCTAVYTCTNTDILCIVYISELWNPISQVVQCSLCSVVWFYYKNSFNEMVQGLFAHLQLHETLTVVLDRLNVIIFLLTLTD
jgi:hypothetical protein